MRKLIAVLAASAALALAAACGGGGTTPGPGGGTGTDTGGGGDGGGTGTAVDFATLLKGTWHGCFPSNFGDTDVKYVFGTTSLAWLVFDHTTTDGSCGGTRSASWNLGGSYALGGAVAVPFGTGGPTVTARKLDRDYGFSGKEFDLAYIDSTVTPTRLYLGDRTTGTMTSDATRPTGIDPTNVLTKL